MPARTSQKTARTTVPVADRASGRRRTRRTGGSDVVFETLRERIASHALPPGSKLRENELAREFGVSRTRVREVFGALEQRGLIQRIPNRGAVVSRLDLKDASDIYDVREYLEALCVHRATQKAPDGAWDDLLARIEPLLGHEFDDEEFDIYLSYLDELRARMLRYADNSFLASMLGLIDDKSHVIARRVIILPGRSATALKLHKEMIEAMKRRDPEEAERLRREILSSARTMLEKYKRFVL
ncbi:MAG: GntR family transcriptional regulator [Hyphomicrobiaceae bacterium]